MIYWAIAGGLNYTPGQYQLDMILESCTFDGKPHSPRRVNFKLHVDGFPDDVRCLLGGRPVFEMHESFDRKSGPTTIKSFYKELYTFKDNENANRQVLVSYLLDIMSSEHSILSRRLILNSQADTAHHEHFIIKCHDFLSVLDFKIEPGWLNTLSEDVYGNVTHNGHDGLFIRKINGGTRQFACAQVRDSVKLSTGQRVRLYFHNPLGIKIFNPAMYQTLDSEDLPGWRYHLF